MENISKEEIEQRGITYGIWRDKGNTCVNCQVAIIPYKNGYICPECGRILAFA